MGRTIFISYRRSEDAGFAGRLFDRLERTFRRKALFMDVDSITPGQDFVSILKARVAECDVLLALIGRGWLTATDEAGHRRLDNVEDFVRIEIATALTQRKCVIPVLIDDVSMPRAEELPEELKPLVRCHATRLSHDRFRADSDGLIRALKQVLADAEAPSPAPDDTSGSKDATPTPTVVTSPPGAKTEISSFKAAWKRFTAHVRMPDWQTLVSKRVTAVGLAVLVVFAGVMAWQQWPTRDQPEPAETTRKDQKITPAAPAPAPESIRPGQGHITQPSESPPDTPSPSTTEPINLLAPENGGKVLKASNKSWLNSIDGNENSYANINVGDEAVYAFKDERPATFNAFEVLILGTNHANLNEFALFSSNDPIGPFSQIGKFQTENILYPVKPYQTFTFPTVTAKYLKVKILSSYGYAFVYVHEFKLLGNSSK